MIFLPTPGALVASRFRLRHPIGKGGMGQVWEAHDRELDSACAIKFILDHLARDPDARLRLVREARAVARLRSPHVVTILGVGEHADAIYLAMELLEGETLATRLERTRRLDGVTTLAIVDQVVQVLDKAHAHGIVHRDLKPDNIWLSADSTPFVKVLDFGVAKSTLKTGEKHTATGALMGTPHYMSPEQAAGDREIDHRSDLWALAVIAMECLSGRRPFESGGLGDLLMKIMQSRPPLAQELDPTLPPALNLWWQQALAHPLDERFQTASELALALRIALGISASPVGASPFAETSRGTWGVAPLPRVPTLVTNITPAPASAPSLSPEPSPATVQPLADAAVKAEPVAAGPVAAGPVAAGPVAAEPAMQPSLPAPVPRGAPATLAVDSAQVTESPPLTEPMTARPERAPSLPFGVDAGSVSALSQTTRGRSVALPRRWPFALAGASIGLMLLGLTWWRLNEPPEPAGGPELAGQPVLERAGQPVPATSSKGESAPPPERSVALALQPEGGASGAAASLSPAPLEPRVVLVKPLPAAASPVPGSSGSQRGALAASAPALASPAAEPAPAPAPIVAPIRIAPVPAAPPAPSNEPGVAPQRSRVAPSNSPAKSAPAKSGPAKSAPAKSAPAKSAPAKNRAPARESKPVRDDLRRRLGF